MAIWSEISDQTKILSYICRDLPDVIGVTQIYLKAKIGLKFIKVNSIGRIMQLEDLPHLAGAVGFNNL